MGEDPERARWSRLFGPHLDAAYRLARWLLGSGPEAEEAVQDACLRAWRADLQQPGDARAWLLAIVRNTALTRLRSARRASLSGKVVDFVEAARELDRLPARDPPPDALLAAHERANTLHQALAALPLPFREAVVLRDIDDLSYGEIAEILGLPPGTVMSRLSRGRRLLRSLLDGEASDARDAR
jgi:RNA polymerase sigma-70 factor (ECF subfamily)